MTTQSPSPLSEDFLQDLKGPVFSITDWISFWASFLITLAVYVYTLAPTVTLEDSGELVVASDYLGVPHPPGYPIWTLVTWFFQWVFHWVEYNGYPNPAWSVGLMSAVFGALTCGILSMLISNSGISMIRSLPSVDEVLGTATEKSICITGAVIGGLMLAFSPGLWSQSVIVEVYSMNTFFLAVIMLAAYAWMSRPTEPKYLYMTGFLFGLGLTNHQTLLFCGSALAVMILFRDVRLFRDFLTAGIALIVLVGINIYFKNNGMENLMWKKGPAYSGFWIFTVLALLVPILSMILLPKGKVVGITILLAFLGVSFYSYLPFASEGNAPMNWAYARTWDGFLHSITRGQYERITLSNVLGDPARFIAQLGAYFTDLRTQYAITGALMAFLPFTTFNITLAGRKLRAFYLAGILSVAATIFAMLASMGENPSGFLIVLYKLLSVGALGLAAIGVINIVARYAIDEIKSGGLSSVLTISVLAFVAAGIAYLDLNLLKFFFESAKQEEKGQFLFLGMILGPILLIGLTYWLTVGPTKMTFETRPLSRLWLLVTLVAFLSLSVILVIFLNPKLDIQTLFIQRVQLIQSHVVYALWIGYGIILTLAIVETKFKGAIWARVLGVLLATAMPIKSIAFNYLDEERVRVIGGAEQNGHDFGWQFGYYQLRGAKGILEEIEPDEAPLPNPDYPPEMTPNAIFYGGTDPGRFVPTYMIYSANVRPDVFLITQNALADNTYMNVMRDLYGDDIWIPSQEDSNFAFQKYVDDVRSGRIQAGADVDISNGRVSVQGVQGVMAINGILAKMIFDANTDRHDFYIEESYVIPWMYPYLEPHGLIMKINKEPITMTDERVKNDREFWDWYSARLMGNKKFIRDVVARKTFSKLRSAIAGLYGHHRRWDDAEHAFRQSIALYPLSPEANFRLADIYMQQRKFDQAQEVISTLLDGDPGNDKVGQFLNQIVRMSGLDKQRVELEKEFSSGSNNIQGAMELLQVYLQLGLNSNFQGLSLQLLKEERVPANIYLQIGQMYSQLKRMDLLEIAIKRYLAREPSDLARWIDLAAVQITLNKQDEAMRVLTQAVKQGGRNIQAQIRNDARLNTLKTRPDYQELIPPAPQAKNLNFGGF